MGKSDLGRAVKRLPCVFIPLFRNQIRLGSCAFNCPRCPGNQLSRGWYWDSLGVIVCFARCQRRHHGSAQSLVGCSGNDGLRIIAAADRSDGSEHLHCCNKHLFCCRFRFSRRLLSGGRLSGHRGAIGDGMPSISACTNLVRSCQHHRAGKVGDGKPVVARI